MGDPIINTQVDAINTTLGTIKTDLTALRPSIQRIRDAVAETYLTETIQNQAIASFSDGADDIPVRELEVAITPVQSGSGDPSPQNIRPITGWSAANVTRVGKNFYNKDTGLSGIWAGNYGNEIISSTNAYSAIVPCAPNRQYRITKTSTSRFRVSYTTKYPEVGDPAVNVASNDSATSIQVTTGDNAQYLVIYCYYKPSDKGTISQADVAASIQVELGSTATDYEPYLGTTYPISLGQTVYGGTLNVTTGVLTIDRKEFDLGSLGWAKSSTVTNGFVATSGLPDWYKQAPNNTTVIPAISDTYTATSYNNWLYGVSGKMSYREAVSGKGIAICDASLASYYQNFDAAAFALAVAGKKIVYTLATPTTVQLTPTEVTTLFGDNNIWCDTNGNIVKLTYRRAWEIALAEGE